MRAFQPTIPPISLNLNPFGYKKTPFDPLLGTKDVILRGATPLGQRPSQQQQPEIPAIASGENGPVPSKSTGLSPFGWLLQAVLPRKLRAALSPCGGSLERKISGYSSYHRNEAKALL
jgi:hypothetical protein